MVSPYSSLPIQPVFGKTTPPRVPAWPGRELGVPGAVAGLKGCHFQCDQTGMHVTPHLSTSCPGGMSFSSCVLQPSPGPQPSCPTLKCVNPLLHSERVCLIPHQKALGTSERC